MGLVDELKGSRVCLDTAPIIYFIEKHERYLSVVRPVFSGIDAEKIEAITSTIALLEVLVHPFRTDNETLAERYREILLYSEGLTTFEISHGVSEMASKLRAEYSIKNTRCHTACCGSFSWGGYFFDQRPCFKESERHQGIDGLVKSRKTPLFVIPAKAGIQFFQLVTEFLDSGFHRSDDFLRSRQF